MLKEYSKFHTCEERGDSSEEEDHDELLQQRRGIHLNDNGINVTTITQQLKRLSKLLEFENISMAKISSTPPVSLKEFDNPQEFYKLLVNYNHLIELMINKNNELTLIKFKCHEIINSMIKQVNQEHTSPNNNPRDEPIKNLPNSADEICKSCKISSTPKKNLILHYN